jgi:hypothetical protein
LHAVDSLQQFVWAHAAHAVVPYGRPQALVESPVESGMPRICRHETAAARAPTARRSQVVALGSLTMGSDHTTLRRRHSRRCVSLRCVHTSTIPSLNHQTQSMTTPFRRRRTPNEKGEHREQDRFCDTDGVGGADGGGRLCRRATGHPGGSGSGGPRSTRGPDADRDLDVRAQHVPKRGLPMKLGL